MPDIIPVVTDIHSVMGHFFPVERSTALGLRANRE
jgi:hypothetical protein